VTRLEAISTKRRTSKDKMGELYQAHAESALRLAYVVTGRRDMAEDLTQEAFVRVFGRFAERRDPRSFERYLRATVLNLAKSYWRRRNTERGYLQRRHQQSTDPASDDLVEGEALWSRLLRLPQRQRTALYLRYYEDLSEQQVAEVMDLSLPAVRSLLMRARKNLKVELEDFKNG
jgi:RNA polymerase sigma factor (sigma-70 family)